MKKIYRGLISLVLIVFVFCTGCGLASSSATDYPAALMVDGEIYLYSVVPMVGEVDESAIIGYTESYTDEYPSENGQTNFNRELGMPYAKVEDGIAVLFQNEWHMCYPNSEKLKNEIIQTYAAEDKEGRLQTYYEMADGTWGTEEHRYLYKLELTGRMHNAAKDSTFVCLSNSEDISFSEVSKSMLSSNMADHLSRKEVVVVELLIVEEPKEDIATDTMPPFTIIDGRYIWLSGQYTPIITPLQEKLDKAEYVGEITNMVSPNKLPSEELESNCFAAGRKLYHYQDDTMETYIVVTEDGTECYFAQEWYVYEKREGGMVKVEEYIVELFPTPTVTPVPTPSIVLSVQDFLTLLKTNYDGKIPSSASSPYVLQADASNCMIVFGQGATTLIYVTRDGGIIWEQAEIPEAGKHQHAVVTCAATISDTTYCVGYRYWGEYDGTNFYLTEDCGKTWARLSPEVVIPEEITTNMRYAEAVAVKYVDDKLQVQVSCKTTVLPPWSIEAELESADLGKTWSVVEIWEKETDEE